MLYPSHLPGALTRHRPKLPAIISSTVCFRSQQNHAPSPTMRKHGRKQGNGGTHEAGQAIDSYGLFEAARVKSPAAFFWLARTRATEDSEAGSWRMGIPA